MDMETIEKKSLFAEIEKLLSDNEKEKDIVSGTEFVKYFEGFEDALKKLKSAVEKLETKDGASEEWVDCLKRMPEETKQTSDTLQGHREWTESDQVLVWDSLYGPHIDSTKNGQWRSEQRGGYMGQVVHGIVAWRPIPEFNEETID